MPTRKVKAKTPPHRTAPAKGHSIPAPVASDQPAVVPPVDSVTGVTNLHTTRASASNGGLRVMGYRGDGSVMLAFNLENAPEPGFAGFAIQCSAPDGTTFFLKNRLTFTSPITANTGPVARHAIAADSNVAPYQKFRWIDFSSSRGPGKYTYTVSAMYHKGTALEARTSASVTLDLGLFQSGNLQVGFTRGFLSSQAYVDQFHNADIRPAVKSITFKTAPFQKQYEWLGFHARQLIFEFLNACIADKNSTLDVFAYDLDEPDIIAAFQKMGPRLRAFLDDAPLHTKQGAMEPLALQALVKSAGAANVKKGHFQRFAHNKVLIQKKNGIPVRVLTGSANFSVRGLYVQANNVLVFDDPETAAHYETAFEQTFQDMAQFSSAEIAEGWIEMSHAPNLPEFALAFSPHKTASLSLDRIDKAIQNAKSSVLFAVMELTGSGPVMNDINTLTAKRPDIFSYGVTQNLSGVSLFKPGDQNGILTPFAFLAQNVPAPFSQEVSGGPGQVIHDKFVIIDFDTTSPVVFTGSSNLAAGGEEQNGDNLLAITDPAIASIYAVQAMGLVDHFHFRAVMKTATDLSPLTLDATDKWWQSYFQKGSLHFRDRNLFCP